MIAVKVRALVFGPESVAILRPARCKDAPDAFRAKNAVSGKLPPIGVAGDRRNRHRSGPHRGQGRQLLPARRCEYPAKLRKAASSGGERDDERA
jgi:hypothetical protein